MCRTSEVAERECCVLFSRPSVVLNDSNATLEQLLLLILTSLEHSSPQSQQSSLKISRPLYIERGAREKRQQSYAIAKGSQLLRTLVQPRREAEDEGVTRRSLTSNTTTIGLPKPQLPSKDRKSRGSFLLFERTVREIAKWAKRKQVSSNTEKEAGQKIRSQVERIERKKTKHDSEASAPAVLFAFISRYGGKCVVIREQN